MRLIVSLIATAAMFMASTAGAVELSVVGANSATIGLGEDVTIDIRLTNLSATSVQGLGASVHGYAGGLDFVSGQGVGNYFNLVCLPAPTGCLGGLLNVAGTANGANRNLAESQIGAFGPRVQIALSAALAPVNGTGVGTDIGLDGVTGSTMFRVTFRGAAAGTYELLIDSSYQGDLVNLGGGGEGEIAGTTFTVTVVPEPGTALLMGLGLMGLAAAGRRE